MKSPAKLKRRSRSASDMKSLATGAGPSRKRSDEIRHWRESYQPSVLRNSVYEIVAEPETETPERESHADIILPARVDSLSHARPGLASHAGRGVQTLDFGPSNSDAGIGSASTLGTELSRELEDRVAKLESGLESFSRSIQKLTAKSHRKTVVVGDVSPSRRPGSERTASMLVDSLQGPPIQSQYSYRYDPPGSPREAETVDVPVTPHAPVREAESSIPHLPADEQSEVPSPAVGESNYRTLYAMLSEERSARRRLEVQYAMLAEERSARRRLELQVRNMRIDLSDMQDQLTRSGMSSQSSLAHRLSSSQSPLLAEPQPRHFANHASLFPNDIGGSRMLADLTSDERSSPIGYHSSGNGGPVLPPQPAGLDSQRHSRRLTSRFSGIESHVSSESAGRNVEAMNEEDEDEGKEEITPQEVYRTPMEEHHNGLLVVGGRRTPIEEGGMF